MSLYGGLDNTKHFEEFGTALVSQAGVIPAATRKATAVANLGITATLAELNGLVGVTSSAAELNILDGATATFGEINTLAGVTAGTVTASKAVVVDANKDIKLFRNFRTTRVIKGEGAAASVSTAGAGSITAAQMLGGIYVRDCNGAGRTDTFDTAAALVAALPGATVGDIIELLVVNGSDAAEAITLAVPASGGFDTNQTAASRVVAQNSSKLVRIRLTNVTGASEAYVVYA